MPNDNHISDVRRHLFAQLEALADTTKALDLDRQRAVCETAQTIINSAKVEVDYLKVIAGAGEIKFLETPDPADGEETQALPAPPKDPLASGPAAGHPWRTSVVHRLKG